MLIPPSIPLIGMVSAARVLSSCIDANFRGCEVIREYYYQQIPSANDNNDHDSINKDPQNQKVRLSGKLKEEGNSRSVVTQADVDAQSQIVSLLRSVWGDSIQLVGEEDEDQDEGAESVTDKEREVTATSQLASILLDDDEETRNLEVSADELTIYIDPLDGTREFVEGRIQNVACLIGIAKNGRALGGCVGVPFAPSEQKNEIETETVVKTKIQLHYALLKEDGGPPLVGSYPPLPPKPQPTNTNTHKPLTIYTGDSNNPILQRAKAHAFQLASSHPSSSTNPPTFAQVGGTAAKLLAIATTFQSIAVLHFQTRSWDTCATEALVRAAGGKVTDLFGSPLVHAAGKLAQKGNDLDTENWLGVVVSSRDKAASDVHDLLCERMRGDEDALRTLLGSYQGGDDQNRDNVGAQAVDVARNLDGMPLSRSWLESQILNSINDDYGDDIYGDTLHRWRLGGYSVPERGTFRGLMSTGCRIHLQWDDATKDDSTSTSSSNQYSKSPPSSAFYKRVVMSESPDSLSKLVNAPHKLLRDVKSYQVESAFLTSRACQVGLIQQAGVCVNRVYGSDLRPTNVVVPSKSGTVPPPPSVQIQSKFAMLLQDFNEDDGWKQEWLLEPASVEKSLEALAKMHGYFWRESDFWTASSLDSDVIYAQREELTRAIWHNGGYMQPSLQGGDEQVRNVARGWEARYPTFREALKDIPELQSRHNLEDDLMNLGTRLEKVAKVVGAKAHPFAKQFGSESGNANRQPFGRGMERYRTFIHGDPKQANIFLRNSDSGELEVALIDFQWCGYGLAATDVAHHICAAVQPSCLSYDGSKEKQLLDKYHSYLAEALVRHGAADSREHVEEYVFPRRVLQEQYEVALLDVCRMVFAYAWKRWKEEMEPTVSSLNRNAYNKSLPNVLWLIVRCLNVLDKLEEGLIQQEDLDERG